jgi:hypothetical protein
LLEKIQQEVKGADKGLAARLERAARMVAILGGLGYAGAYLGGEHHADRVRWIIRRSEALGGKWEELAEELAYAPKGGFVSSKARRLRRRDEVLFHRCSTHSAWRSLYGRRACSEVYL